MAFLKSNKPQTKTISVEEYKRLKTAEITLQALEIAGITEHPVYKGICSVVNSKVLEEFR
ncbi:MAG: hypothetical protein LUD02_03615 [Tannerellaceae bacterium]|nr:hypothetical protein [Tannerellaceae bacterium]